MNVKLLFFLSISGVSLTFEKAFAQPANDDCANAKLINFSRNGFDTGAYASGYTSFTGATIQSGEFFYNIIRTSGLNKKSVWFRFELKTARALRITLMQSGNNIAISDVGFTTFYKANGCFPDSSHADSAKLTPINKFGNSYHPCLKPGTYYVQVCAKNNVTDSIQIEVDLGNPKILNPDINFHKTPYNFGTLSHNAQKAVSFETGCLTIDSSHELNCIDTNYTKPLTQSAWFTFKTSATVEWFGLYFRNEYVGGAAPPSSFDNYMYAVLYEGDVKNSGQNGISQVGDCVRPSLTSSYYYKEYMKDWRCVLKPNTTYSIKLLFHKDFDYPMYLAIKEYGQGKTLSPKPVRSAMNPLSFMGTLPKSYSGVTTTLNDYFSCESKLFHSNVQCGTENQPKTKASPYSDSSLYNLSTWFRFDTDEKIKLYFYMYTAAYFTFEIYSDSIDNNCNSLNKNKLFYSISNPTTGYSFTLNCLPKGKYSVHIRAMYDTTGEPGYSYFWNNKYRNAIGEKLTVQLTAYKIPQENRYSLKDSTAVYLYNGKDSLTDLPPNAYQYSDYDTLACNVTLRPEKSDSCFYYYPSAVKLNQVSYHQFRIGDYNKDNLPDSGMLLVNATYNVATPSPYLEFYKGNAKKLAIAQNKWSYPDTLSGLKKVFGCQGMWYYNTNPYKTCETAGDYTIAIRGNENHNSAIIQSNVLFDTTRTKYYSRQRAANLGNVSANIGYYTYALDYFTCLNNVDTISGNAPCYNYQTKLLYRQFYISDYRIVRYMANYGYGGNFSLYKGKALDSLVPYQDQSGTWLCRSSMSNTDCDPLPPGWYTVVSYGRGPTFGDPYQYHYDLGGYNYLYLGLDTFKKPKFNRPFKANLVNKGYPLNTNWKYQSYYNGATNYEGYSKDTCFEFEQFFCLKDSAWMHQYMGDYCDNSYTKVAFYVFRTTATTHMALTGFYYEGSTTGILYNFDVRTDSSKLLTEAPLQSCITDQPNGNYKFCDMKPGWFTFVVLAKENMNGYTITPCVRVEPSKVTRNDFASFAYDFDTIRRDSVWVRGKPGDVHAENNKYDASASWIYCGTSASKTDPYDLACPNTSILSTGNRAAQKDSNRVLFPHHQMKGDSVYRRNIWYTFVLKGSGKCNVSIDNVTNYHYNNTYDYNTNFSIYESNETGVLDFDSLKQQGRIDSTYAQGLKFIMNNQYPGYPGYYCGYSGYLINTVTFNKNSCNDTLPKRYYVLVDNLYDYQYFNGQYHYPFQTNMFRMEIKYDGDPNGKVKYDHYSQANVINGLKKATAPYKDSILKQGTYAGALGHFECTTKDASDQNTCGTRTIWYKFKVASTGLIRIAYDKGDGVKRYYENYYQTELMLFKSVIDGDSTSAGLKEIPRNVDYYNNGYWRENCITEGTYYLMFTGCNMTDVNSITPYIQLVDHIGDRCGTAQDVNISGTGTYSNTVLVDCHTIGNDWGENGKNTGCLNGPSGYKSSWFKINITDTFKYDLTFKMSENTSASASSFGYRLLIGNCIAFSTGPCNKDLLTQFTINCMKSGTYYIQVFSPNSATGTIRCEVIAVKTTDQTCKPIYDDPVLAAFIADIKCKRDTVFFTNYSSRNKHTQYLWKTGYNNYTDTNRNIFFVYPKIDSVKTYTVKLFATDTLSNNTDSMEQDITIYPHIKGFLGKDTTICSGNSVILSALYPGASAYLWDDASTSSTRVADTAGTYIVRVTYGNIPCIIADTINITFATLNIPHLKDTSVCPGDSVRFIMNVPGASFKWQDNSTDSSIKIANTGGYIWVDVNKNGCVARDSIFIILKNRPVINLPSDSVFCSGDSIKLDFSALTDISMVWNGTINSKIITFKTPGKYKVNFSSASSGCKNTDSINITETPLPIINILDSTFCKGDTVIYFVGSGYDAYNWYDNSVSNSISIKTQGTYWIRVRKNNCYQTDTFRLTEKNLPNFSLGKDTGTCLTLLTVKGPKGNFVYAWNNNTGADSLNVNSSGNYYLRIKDNTTQCYFSDTVKVSFYNTPQANIIIDSSLYCLKNNSFRFSSNPLLTGEKTSFLWTFSDSTGSTDSSLNKSFNYKGNYIVKLKVTSIHNCMDSALKSVNVYPMPVAKFIVNDSTQCFKSHSIVLTNTSILATGTNTYLWRFGDNTTSTTTSPTKSYAAYGNYNIRLVVNSDKLCSDSISKPVEVYPMPVAEFTVNDSTQCFKSHSIVLTNTSTLATGTNTYLWRFGDNSTSTVTSPTKTYSAYGNYSIRLVVNSDKLCSDSISKPVEVYPMPVAKFTVNDSTQCFKSHSIVLSNTSTLATGTNSYLWRFGDNSTSTVTSPTKTYSAYGNYSIRLVVNSDKLCSDSISKPVEVYPMPVAKFTVNDSTQCFKSHSIVLTNTSTLATGTNSYLWRFGDNSTSTVTSPTKTYSAYGNYSIRLVVNSDKLCSDSIDKPVEVYPMPVAKFTINDSTQCFKSHSIVLSNTSTLATGTNTYLWRFGDNSTSTVTSPTKTYSAYGNYSIRLVVNSDKLCSDSISKPVEVYPMPVAKFTVNDSTQCFKSHSIVLSNTSTLATGTNTYLWRFGDNTTSTVTSPTKTYAAYGNYSIRLVVNSDKLCSDSISKPVEVYPMPVAKFTVNDSTQCFKSHAIVLTNTSTLATGTNSYLWRFGDNTTSTTTSPTKSYAAYGNYSIRLVVNSDKLCSDSISKPVEVYPMPVAKFTVNDSTQCFKSHAIVLTNTSTLAAGTNTYLWQFGDNSTSTVTSPTKTYSAYGNYSIRLVVNSDKLCSDSISKPVEVYPMPVAKFTVNDSTQCFKSHSVVLSNTSTLATGTNTYLWRFGDNTTSTTTSPTKSYAAYGNYSIRLVVNSDKLCSDSISKPVEVYPMPVAKFTVNDSTQCFKSHSVVLTNTSTLATGTNTYLWRFGDNTTSTTTSPTKSYAAYGNYSIRLVVNSDKLCSDSIDKPVEVYPMPVAKFTVNDSTQCFKNHSIVLTNTSTLAAGTNSYLWRFGDNSTSTVTSPTKTYSAYGNYSIRLVVNSDKLCSDSISKPVEVYPMPVAKFTVNDSTQCFKNHSIVLSNTSTLAAGTNSYLWRFGDNSTSTTTSPTKTYSAYGNYSIRLVVNSDKLCSDSIDKPVEVYPMPVAKFTVNDSTQCFKSHSIVLTNTSTLAAGTNSYLWRFGDNSTSTTTSPTKTYSTYGNYSIRLVVNSDKLCSDSISKPVEVYPMPVAKFTVNDSTQCFKSHSIVLSNTSTLAAGTNSYLWRFGDNSTSTVTSPTKTYSAYGNYSIRLVVNSDKLCSDSIDKPVEVYPMPVAKFTVNDSTQCFKSHSIVLSNTSTLATGTNSYLWRFGDNSTSTVTSPTKTYSAYGNYSVRLVVNSDKLCSDSISKPVEVYPMPVAKFTVNDSTQCFKSHSIVLTNTSTLATGTNSYLWRFGDNSTSTTTSPTKTYAAYGNYSIRLIVNSDKLCSDSISKPVEVYPMPVAKFTVNDSTQCFKSHSIVLSNTSTLATGTNSYLWRFGDNSTSTVTSPTKTYSAYGNYSIRLVVNSDKLCSDSISKPVEVYPMPVAKFTVNDSTQCFKSHSIVLTNTSTLATGTNSYLWRFGDNSTSTVTSPTKTYSAYGNYSVRLVVNSDKLCSDSISKPVEVYPMPVAKFTVNDSTQCFKSHSIVLSNTSTLPAGTNTYLWRFGDNSTSTVTSPTKTYAAYGNYSVRLVVNSDKLCSDSISKPVEIYSMPVAKFTVNDSTQCFKNHSIVLTNTSTLATGTNIYLWRFGDNSTSTVTSPTKTYSAYGNYSIRLVVNSDKLCSDSISKPVEVYPMPVAKFTVNDSTQCFKSHSIVLTNTSTLATGTNTYLWRFGDNTTSTTTSTTKTYSAYGNYSIRLVVNSDKLCSDSISIPVEVYPMPVAEFTVNDSTQCFKSHSIVLTNTSTLATGTNSYLWRFGDNTTSTTTSPTKSYAAYGNYSVRLVVNSDKLCSDSISKPVEVYPMPVAKFTVNDSTQCFKSHSVVLTNNSTLATGTNTYLWRFGDNTTSTTTSPTKSYAAYGNYNIRLVVNSDKLCSDSISKPVEVYPMPVAKFTVNDSTQCFKSHAIVLTNTSTLATGTNTYLWRFGDNTTSTTTSPTKSYAAYGNYYIELFVTTDKLCNDSVTKPVEVYPMPTVLFTINDSTQCYKGHSFTFGNNSIIAQGNISQLWHFGDNTTSITNNPGKTYTTYGNYLVNLVITSDQSCKDSLAKPVEVNRLPLAGFKINKSHQCYNNNLFKFVRNLQMPPLNIASYQWDFGDLSSGSGDSVTHQFNSIDSFKVKLTAVSDKNCMDTGIQTVYIHPHPAAKVTVNNDQQCLTNNRFVLNDNSIISFDTIIGNLWTLPDFSTVLNQSSLVRTFTLSGVYKFKLRSITNRGCTAEDSVNLIVHPQPQVSFALQKDTQCLDLNSFLYNGKVLISSGSITEWEWQFGDNTSANVQNPPGKTYMLPGDYPVSVNVVSDKSCRDTFNSKVHIAPMPNPDFAGENVCLKKPVNFSNLSTISQGQIQNYLWNLGDGQTDNSFEPVHFYSQANSYNITLTATSNLGCSITATKNNEVIIEGLPDVNFIFRNTYSFEKSSQWQFNGLSNSNIIQWNWNFGNKFSSVLQDPLLDLTDSMSLLTTLTVTSSIGCVNSSSQLLNFYADPTIFIPNAFTPQNDGVNDGFRPVGIGYMNNYTFQIYNRWGEKIFETDDYSQAWDGTYQGELVQNDVYLFIVHGVNIAKQFVNYRGTVTVLR